MNGNFERNESVYPIGYLLNGDASIDGPTYDIVDMRTMEIVLRTKYTAKQLVAAVHTLNERIRADAYADGSAKIEDDAAALVAEANTPQNAPVADAVAPESVPDAEQVGQRTQQVRAPQSLAFVPPIEPLEKL